MPKGMPEISKVLSLVVGANRLDQVVAPGFVSVNRPSPAVVAGEGGKGCGQWGVVQLAVLQREEIHEIRAIGGLVGALRSRRGVCAARRTVRWRREGLESDERGH